MPFSFFRFKKKTPSSLKAALTDSRLNALKENIREALFFLRKTHLKTIFYRKKLPWYVVLGPEDSGKTTLLASSGLHLVSTDDFSLQHITRTAYCQWFFGKEAVFIDASGALMLPKHADASSLTLWQKFIQLLYHFRHFKPLDGLILCIDLMDFEQKSHQQQIQYLDILRHHLNVLQHSTPIHILFTRCDRIKGFSEFFEILPNEEREQICGISLPELNQQNFAQSLEEEFNAFLSTLNQRLLQGLQKERVLEKRFRIKNFPLQLEAYKKTIIQINNHLHSVKNPIKSIYFTSSKQEGPQQDALARLLNTFGLSSEKTDIETAPQKHVFFIKNALQKIIHDKKPVIEKQTILEKFQTTRVFYWTLGSIWSIALLVLLTGYFENRRTILQIESFLTAYQNQPSSNPTSNAFYLLETLQKSEDALHKTSHFFTHLVFPQIDYLESQLNKLYNQTIDVNYAPKIKTLLETELQNEIKTNSPTLFNTLKVYLMSQNNAHRDTSFMESWFANYAQIAFANNPESKQLFTSYLRAWLTRKSDLFQINPDLVNKARQTLNQLSTETLIYASLEQQYSSDLKQLYNAKQFETIDLEVIPSLTEKFIKNDGWVLGETTPAGLNKIIIPQITANVSTLYIKHYVDFWKKELSNIRIPNFENINEAYLYVSTLNTKESLLLDPLNLTLQNLAPVATHPEAKELISSIEHIQILLAQNQLSADTSKSLQHLKSYLNDFVKASDPEQAVLSATQKRMTNSEEDEDVIHEVLDSATKVPAPLGDFLKQLANNTWQVMLKTSETRLNTLWKTEVLSTYRTQVLDHYPVFKNGGSGEMSLADFEAFFGPTGTMASFFKKHLSPFVNNSSLYWQWKKLDGMSIPISQTTLEMFNRAAIIQKMYFSGDEKSLSVKFSITPADVDFISTNLVLNIAGQSINYASDFRQMKRMSWPNKTSKSNSASLSLIQGNKKHTFYEETGDWAVFKLLSYAKLIPSHNPEMYTIEFTPEGQKVTYELSASTEINPFIPNILTAFRCPDTL